MVYTNLFHSLVVLMSQSLKKKIFFQRLFTLVSSLLDLARVTFQQLLNDVASLFFFTSKEGLGLPFLSCYEAV